MKPKFDWERVKMEDLMRERGTETIRSEKVKNRITSVKCRHCRQPLPNGGPKTELKHMRSCDDFQKSSRGNYWGQIRDAKPITYFARQPNFPSCMIGQKLRATVSGTVTAIIAGSKVQIENHLGKRRTFKIDLLLKMGTAEPKKPDDDGQ